MIHHGDCLDVMAGMEPESVDAIVTDPPYGLEFMGKAWDKLDWRDGGGFSKPGIGDRPTAWTSFGGDTANATCATCGGRMRGARKCDCAEPDWRVKGAAMTNRAADRAAGMQSFHAAWAVEAYRVAKPSAYLLAFGGTRTVHRMTCAIEDAGWIIRDMLVWAYASGFPKSKASLKPAWEPIVMARKPGPLRALAIDECRIGTGAMGWETPRGGIWRTDSDADAKLVETGGRWPANVILTDPIFDGGWEGVVGGGETASGDKSASRPNGGRLFRSDASMKVDLTPYPGDSGTYSRFFLIPKAARSDREPVLGAELRQPGHLTLHSQPTGAPPPPPRSNVHPTVKPVDLMRHLVRLVTPTGGTVLDPFLGSGTTALAAEMEGFAWIGIEREAEYVAIAEARLNGTQQGMAL